MAQLSSFVNTSRARVTAYLKLKEDLEALQAEFNALGGVAFIPAQADPFWTGYDMTRVQYLAMLTAVGQLITVGQGGSVTADATRPTALYAGKV